MLLRVISTEGELFHGTIDKVSVPTEQGVLGILPGHMNVVCPLIDGNITYVPVVQNQSLLESFADHHHTLSVLGGLMMIEDDIVTIAAE